MKFMTFSIFLVISGVLFTNTVTGYWPWSHDIYYFSEAQRILMGVSAMFFLLILARVMHD